MVTASVVEDQSVSPAAAGVNWNALIQRFLEGQGYKRILHQSTFLNFAWLLKFEGYYVCDLMIVGFAEDVEGAEAIVPRLDMECARIRRALLRGRPFQWGTSVKEHHFITLHKPLIQHSYECDGLPVGFLIRPLILVHEEDQWDYFSGSTSRVDVLSLDSQALNRYMERHKEEIRARHASLVNLGKYRYHKLSNYLLDYGHYPLIIAWIVYLFFAIFQSTLPISLGGMIALTGLIYGSFVGFACLSYWLFQHQRATELQEVAHYHATRHQGQVPRPTANGALVELVVDASTDPINAPAAETAPDLRAEPSQDQAEFFDPDDRGIVGQGVHSHDQYYASRIKRSIRKIHRLHQSQEILVEADTLLRNVFCWIIGRGQQHIPRNDPLPNLLGLARHDGVIAQRFDMLLFWVRKITTKTPFANGEVVSIKNDLIGLLGDLRMLPPGLKVDAQEPAQGTQPPTTAAGDAPTPPTEVAAPTIQEQIADLREQVEQMPSPPPLPELPAESHRPAPNFDAATLPHLDIPQMSAEDIMVMQQSESNGIYCRLHLEAASPNVVEIVDRFNYDLCDADVIKGYHYIDPNDPPQLLSSTPPPYVVVGCGMHKQDIPYGEDGDGARVRAVVASFQKPSCSFSLREKGAADPKSEGDEEPAKANPITIEPPPVPKPVRMPENAAYREAGQASVRSSLSQDVNGKSLLERNLPEFCPGSVLIDGTNLVYLHSDIKRARDPTLEKTPTLDCVFEVLEEIAALGIPQDRVAVYFDANIYRVLGKNGPVDKRLAEYAERGLFHVVTGGTEADSNLVSVSNKLGGKFLVISNDRFREKVDREGNVTRQAKPVEFRKHRVAVGVGGPGNHAYLVIESVSDLLNAFYGTKDLPPSEQSSS
ncbi:MAG: hypothetical protein HWN65_14395 [Candidatus Helarchaeota archaeon]|nr:hypothetical protein [Candidatus Helarchaeota archaeon]